MERGTAARKGRARASHVVAELDDDVAVSSSGLKTKRTNSDALIRQSADQTSRGRRLSSAWQIRSTSKESCIRKLRRVKRHTFFRVISGEADARKTLESSSAHLGNLISDCRARASFTGSRATQSRPFFQPHMRVRRLGKPSSFDSHSKRWNRSAEAGDENRRGEGKSGFGNEHFSNAKTDSPAEAIEGVVKRIDLLGSETCS